MDALALRAPIFTDERNQVVGRDSQPCVRQGQYSGCCGRRYRDGLTRAAGKRCSAQSVEGQLLSIQKMVLKY